MQVSKRLIVLGIFGLLALPLMGVASAQNMLTNGTFETGDLTGWETFGTTPISFITVESPDNGPSFPGMHNVFLDNHNDTNNCGISQGTGAGSAGPGTYYFLFDLQRTETTDGAVFFVKVIAEVAGGGAVGETLQGPYFPAVGEWITVTGTFEAMNPNTNFLTIQLMANTGAIPNSASSYHVDNAYLGAEPAVGVEEMSMGSIKALFR